VILGPITVGDGARIGAGSVVVKAVPPKVTAIGVPARIVDGRRRPIPDLEHGRLPDPVAEAIGIVLEEQDRLEERLRGLESAMGVASLGGQPDRRRREVEMLVSQGGGI
jgi:serine O-acetyltransferase